MTTYSSTLLKWKWRRTFLYEMVNRRGQVDIFVKRVKLVLTCKFFYKNKPWATRNEGFTTYVDSKPLTWKSRQWNYYSIIRKGLGFKVWAHVFLWTILQEHKSPFSSHIIYHYFYASFFMFGIDSVSSSLFEKLI